MKVFNITDASTSALVSRGLVNQAIKVGDTIIPKGGSAVLKGTARERAELQVYIKVRAITIDELPPAYAARRGLRVDGTPLVPPAPSAEPEPPHPPPVEVYVDPKPADAPDESPRDESSRRGRR